MFLFEYSLRNTEVQIIYPVVLVLLLTDLNTFLNVADPQKLVNYETRFPVFLDKTVRKN